MAAGLAMYPLLKVLDLQEEHVDGEVGVAPRETGRVLLDPLFKLEAMLGVA